MPELSCQIPRTHFWTATWSSRIAMRNLPPTRRLSTFMSWVCLIIYFAFSFSFVHNITISDDGNAWKLNTHMQDATNSFGQAFWLLMYVLLQYSCCETCFWNGPCHEQEEFNNNRAEWIPTDHQPRLENPQVEPDWRSVACHPYPLLFRLWNGVRIDLYLPSGAYLVQRVMALL